ncbi:MAG: cellulose synthase [Gemmatimonadetes bacterium]|nr:cellulose synthase [Gemmatimonadota bacterium]
MHPEHGSSPDGGARRPLREMDRTRQKHTRREAEPQSQGSPEGGETAQPPKVRRMAESKIQTPPYGGAKPYSRRPANAVPRLSPWQERAVRAVAVVTLAYWTYYIAWRWTSTLNTHALWFSIPLALAETWGLLTAFVMTHSVWRIRHRTPVAPPPGMSVDVFITCYDEPLEVIRRTAVGARSIRYPHKTWLLDDGRRDEVRSMAEALGVGYLTRPTNEHAKAGNLNNALKHTDGGYILQLDADHVPLPHMLDRLLGFFAEDPGLGFVQSPQDFYNTDGFTYDVSETGQRIWEEQRLFFGVIQPGKDRINGTFFCGSCAVIRRAALDGIGGFSTHSITEDIETSMKLHAAGWRSAFYGESLAYGLAAGSAVAFHTQHLRWGQGAMQVLRKYNPLTLPGLTLAQRVSYFGSLTAYVGGLQKLVYYAAPIVFFLTGTLPIKALNAEFLARFLPFLVLSIAMGEALGRGRSRTMVAERYHMVKFWTYTKAVLSILRNKPLTFKVTPKGPGHVPFATYAPHVTLMALSVAAVAWATLASRFGWMGYGGQGWGSTAFRTNALWLVVNFAFAAQVVRLSLRVRQQRADHRFRDRFPVTARVRGMGGKLRPSLGIAEDLNPGGMAFRLGTELAEGTAVKLTLPLSTRSVEVRGTVLHCERVETAGTRVFRCGVRFDAMPVNARDAIELHCTQHAVPSEQSQYHIGSPLLVRTLEWMRNVRRDPRRRVRLPARVALRGREQTSPATREHAATLEELSRNGARLVMSHPVSPGTPITFRVPGTKIQRSGRVVFSHAIETPIGVRFSVGVERDRPSRPAPSTERSVTRAAHRAGGAVPIARLFAVRRGAAGATAMPLEPARTDEARGSGARKTSNG